jgi:N12 class adenine-specific DNA methylase
MDMEQIEKTMERLLTKMKMHLERMEAQAADNQKKEEAFVKELRDDKKGNQEKMEAVLEGLRSCGNATTTCQGVT